MTAPALWLASDDAFQLRRLGTLNVFKLPTSPPFITHVGARPNCGVRLTADDSVSGSHALLLKQQGRWTVHDLESTNGTWRNGVRVAPQAAMHPGDELRFGNATLVVEGDRYIALRRWLTQRLDCNLGAVPDLALRAVLRWARTEDELILESDDDAVAVARELHAKILGPDQPFVVADPLRATALDLASGGTLCIRLHQPPRDLPAILDRFDARSTDARLIICRRSCDITSSRTQPIIIPPRGASARDARASVFASWLSRKRRGRS